MGDYAVAERAVGTLVDLSDRLGMPFWRQLANCLDGELRIRRGEAEKGSALLRAALDEMLSSRRALHHVGFLYALAEGLGSAGKVAEGLATIEDAFARADHDGERWCEAELHRVKGDLLCLAGSSQSIVAAESCFLESLAVAQEHGALFWELRAALSLARLRIAQQRSDEARELLERIYEKFTEGFDTQHLHSARALLTTLSSGSSGQRHR